MPRGQPWIRIDHIVCDSLWEIVSADVGESNGSCHKMVSASIRMKAPQYPADLFWLKSRSRSDAPNSLTELWSGRHHRICLEYNSCQELLEQKWQMPPPLPIKTYAGLYRRPHPHRTVADVRLSNTVDMQLSVPVAHGRKVYEL